MVVLTHNIRRDKKKQKSKDALVNLSCLSYIGKLKDYLLNKLVERLRRADEGVAVANFLSPKARLARALLQFGQHLGEPTTSKNEIFIRHKIPHHDLAALARVAHETASRILSEWRQCNIILRRSACYSVDRAALEREAHSQAVHHVLAQIDSRSPPLI
jgi:CRP/FNR family transcriptional regulator